MSTDNAHSTQSAVTTPELSGDRLQSLGDDLVQLNDEINEVVNINAFMYHALCLSLTEPDALTKDVSSGAQLCCFWVAHQNAEVKTLAQQVLKRYLQTQSPSEV